MIRFVDFPTGEERTAGIRVIGVGGCGQNAVDQMINMGIAGVEFYAVNTDNQALNRSKATNKIQIGSARTRGLGAGGVPDVGRGAAQDDTELLSEPLRAADMVFITAGMGGGTGTGAAPVIARLAQEANVLTVGVVTKPFNFEGRLRMLQAEEGIRELKEHVDTLLVIPNQKLITSVPQEATISDAFRIADSVLCQAVRGISDLITVPGYINLDFADVRKIMAKMGMALMGTAEAEGKTRARDALQQAIACPLLDDLSIHGAKGILINITGGRDLTLREIDEANTMIFEQADREANIIWGYVVDDQFEGKVKITVIATGFDNAAAVAKPAKQYVQTAIVPDTQPPAPPPAQHLQPPKVKQHHHSPSPSQPQYDEQQQTLFIQDQDEPQQTGLDDTQQQTLPFNQPEESSIPPHVLEKAGPLLESAAEGDTWNRQPSAAEYGGMAGVLTPESEEMVLSVTPDMLDPNTANEIAQAYEDALETLDDLTDPCAYDSAEADATIDCRPPVHYDHEQERAALAPQIETRNPALASAGSVVQSSGYQRRRFESLPRMRCLGDGNALLDHQRPQFPVVMKRFQPGLGPARLN